MLIHALRHWHQANYSSPILSREGVQPSEASAFSHMVTKMVRELMSKARPTSDRSCQSPLAYSSTPVVPDA